MSWKLPFLQTQFRSVISQIYSWRLFLLQQNQADKGLWNNTPSLPVEKSGLSPVCAQAFYPSRQQTWPNSNSPQDILTQNGASAGPTSEGREEQKERSGVTCTTPSVPHVYTGGGFSNELVQSSVMHEGKRDTQKQTHGKPSDSHIVEGGWWLIQPHFCHLKPA